jgi:hypothetical protein
LVLGVSIENLFLPVFLVVGQPLDELQVEFAAALLNLARICAASLD